ncbi:uncharacterized protein BX664DRAFT_326073 [Halteromyces radiatus]|uniref:uncharacterized protein n=1 Tax=Halteromyces radiatus TaxID=101107 RepID=UPI00222103A6|nr:uncharacterized protein BX664DRAFT_326073 [Halteromyces radiatus]KAI8097303.1 hypothetical protein BX664DRAFT_326073 [Halteromyces radiatus]
MIETISTTTTVKDPFRFHVSAAFDLNQDQWETLIALMDTFIGALDDEEAEQLADRYSQTGLDRESIIKFAKLKSSDLENYKSVVLGFLNRAAAPEKRSELQLILSVLSTRAGTFALTGHFAPFSQLSLKDREAAVNGWRHSFIPQLRLLFKSFSGVCLNPVFVNKENRVLHRAMGFPAEDPVRNHPDYQPVNPLPRLPMLTESELLSVPSWDCIIIGSGGGGGVTAAELAKTGKSVLVIEKGTYYHESDLSLVEGDAMSNLYEAGGFFSSTDGNVNIAAGSTFGGGTTVNWSASLKLQHFVREEWAKQGLTHFISPKFTSDLERVFERIGASTTGVKHNNSNQHLVDGCKALGYHIADLHQNTGGRSHSCGFCFAGCKDGIKNGTSATWLRDAQQYGAKFIDRTKVLRVLVENNKAVGVEAVIGHEQGQRKVKIYSDTVVCAAGSLQTPGVLQRSGLKNKHIGRHLRIHPSAITYGYFEQPVDTFEGSIMTAVSNVAENVDGEGYGAKLEVPATPAGSFSSIILWRGIHHHKEKMLRYRHYSPILVLARDKDTESCVRYDEHGNLAVDYNLSNHDRQSILAGILRSLDVLVAAGAREVETGQFAIDPFVFGPHEQSRVDNPRYIAWRNNVAKVGLPPFGAGIYAAHQMGTARMGISPNVSATKPTGETWEVKQLYVADTSLFPTATGVNPMVTVEAVALHVADCIAKNGAASAKL